MWIRTPTLRTVATTAQTVMTSTQRRARRVKMTPPSTMDSSRQTTSSATWTQAMKRMAATEYGTTRYATSGKVVPVLGCGHGHEDLREHGSEQEDDENDAEKPTCELGHLSSIDRIHSTVNRSMVPGATKPSGQPIRRRRSGMAAAAGLNRRR